MDIALLIVSAVATAAAVASAIVAIVQARAAKASERDALTARDESRLARDEGVRLAAEANSAFVRQAEAQEQANALKVAELTPPPWSGPNFVSGDTWAVVNSSGRAIKVELMEVYPDEAERWVTVYGPESNVYGYGQSLDFMYISKMHPRPQTLTLSWRYEDEPDSPLNSFIIPL